VFSPISRASIPIISALFCHQFLRHVSLHDNLCRWRIAYLQDHVNTTIIDDAVARTIQLYVTSEARLSGPLSTFQSQTFNPNICNYAHNYGGRYGLGRSLGRSLGQLRQRKKLGSCYSKRARVVREVVRGDRVTSCHSSACVPIHIISLRITMNNYVTILIDQSEDHLYNDLEINFV